MSWFTQYKLKDGRKIRGRYDSKSTKVCISRLDLEELIHEADVAYEQAEQLQTIIENLVEIKRQAITKVINELMAEIEQRSYGIANDSVIRGVKHERTAILEIIDKYRAESEDKE